MAQFMRPEADLFNGGWLRENGNSVNIFESVNDPVQDDTDYAQSGLNPVNQVLVLKLSTVVDPGIDTGHIFRIYGGKDQPGGRIIDVTIQLREDYVNESNQGTLRASQTFLDIVPIATPFPTFFAEINTAGIAGITNYGNLALRIVANTRP